jgi:hypothetical protein
VNSRLARIWIPASVAGALLCGGVLLSVASGSGANDAAAQVDPATTTTQIVEATSTTATATTTSTVLQTTTLPPETTTTVKLPFSRENPRPLPKESGTGRRIVYKNRANWVWIVDENDQVVLSAPVSGKKGVPNPRTYKVFGKGEFSQSIFYPEIKMKWSTRFAISPNGKNTIAFHSLPECTRLAGHCSPLGPMQTEEQLGTFQSGGCIRMADRDAEFLFNFAELGTTVVVLK